MDVNPTVDEARAALLQLTWHNDHEHAEEIDALIAAVRAEYDEPTDRRRGDHTAGYNAARRESAETLRALREALEAIALLYTDNRTRPATFAIRAGEIAVAALDATEAE